MDEKEIHYIEHYNTLVPNGYNIRTGGNDGEHIRYEGKTTKILVPTENKQRKNEDDEDLPRHIIAIRKKGVLEGYKVELSIRNADREHYIKTFTNKEKPEEALGLAIQDLANLKLTKNTNKNNKTHEKVKTINEYIHPIMKNHKIAGYEVKGLIDTSGNEIPPKTFDENTNRWNLDKAKKYLTQIENIITNNIEISDWSKIDTIPRSHKQGIDGEYLPKYVRIYKYNGEKKGYIVEGFRVNGTKLPTKTFGDTTNYTMKELYDQAIEHLNQLYETHKKE